MVARLVKLIVGTFTESTATQVATLKLLRASLAVPPRASAGVTVVVAPRWPASSGPHTTSLKFPIIVLIVVAISGHYSLPRISKESKPRLNTRRAYEWV